ncbi:hypothetical protein KIM372_15950 [Bombiscardovia nodaiensis]|uniref:LysR substrate-binding domain-containing protein n=1 Tax=Bombiscardovia nodaiensis TaxID=2932181 RepID=A0ABM8B9W8_9BIFI|nr:hypothetical protein KIM372_15950 [Bombiscardovia nodaiensis]
MRSDDPLAQGTTLRVEDIQELPLLLPTREIVQNDLLDRLGLTLGQMRVAGTSDLINNSIPLILTGHYYELTIHGALALRPDHRLAFVPLTPSHASGHAAVWRKNEQPPRIVEEFMKVLLEDTEQPR